METWFNRNPLVVGEKIRPPSQDAIENTFNLRQASLEDAARYGGSITREALGAMKFKGDRNYIIVDTKVNLLMKGMIPAIPGWHTDGVPRGADLKPGGKGEPNMLAQVKASMIEQAESDPRDEGFPRSSHYHLLVTGRHSQTEFINNPMLLRYSNDRDLYENLTLEVDQYLADMDPEDASEMIFTAPEDTVIEWDWWNIHRAVEANATAWRYLIRVTETDNIQPRTSPNDFIRTQSQVYVPTAFGW